MRGWLPAYFCLAAAWIWRMARMSACLVPDLPPVATFLATAFSTTCPKLPRAVAQSAASWAIKSGAISCSVSRTEAYSSLGGSGADLLGQCEGLLLLLVDDAMLARFGGGLRFRSRCRVNHIFALLWDLFKLTRMAVHLQQKSYPILMK